MPAAQESVDEIFGSIQLVTGGNGQRPAVSFGRHDFGPDQQRILPTQVQLYAGPYAELAVAATVVGHDSGDVEAEKGSSRPPCRRRRRVRRRRTRVGPAPWPSR